MVLRPGIMSTKGTTDPAISRAFDREAGGYAARWERSPLVQYWRCRVLARVLGAVPAGGRVADLGCGPGADAAALSAAGLRVVGIDVSPGMVALARARGVAAEVGSWAEAPARLGGGHDACLSNFGVLNCLDSLGGLGAVVRALVRPGGHVVLVWMSRHCPAETVACLARGRRPRRGRPEADVRGVRVPLRWWSVAEVVAALGPGVTVRRVEALGLLDAPPDLGGRLGRRSAAEPWLSGWPGLRHLGDHTLLHATLP